MIHNGRVQRITSTEERKRIKCYLRVAEQWSCRQTCSLQSRREDGWMKRSEQRLLCANFSQSAAENQLNTWSQCLNPQMLRNKRPLIISSPFIPPPPIPLPQLFVSTDHSAPPRTHRTLQLSQSGCFPAKGKRNRTDVKPVVNIISLFHTQSQILTRPTNCFTVELFLILMVPDFPVTQSDVTEGHF